MTSHATIPRGIMALEAGRRLSSDIRPVWKLVTLMALTDKEGSVARIVDKLAPESGARNQ